jgi:4-hydroxybenzoate polyprenyltransferase
MKSVSDTSSCSYQYSGLSRLKLFWALSRTPHGLLDMCTAGLGALLWLGEFPVVWIVLVGLITVFAGYTAVYAFNDMVGYRSDRRKLEEVGIRRLENCSDLDAVFVRHPMPQGLLSFKEGLVWSLAWAVLALIGAYLLNPMCVVIFLAGCILETIYCLMWKVSPYRTLISGVVKTAGAVAAVFAVDSNPSSAFLAVLVFTLFFWEIGGQNVPNDWIDLDEDRRFRAQTVPIRLGTQWSKRIILGAMVLTILDSLLLVQLSQIRNKPALMLGFLIAGGFLLLIPAIKLYRSTRVADAMTVFNKASYYPLALLALVFVAVLV